jgi:hypothetical protein
MPPEAGSPLKRLDASTAPLVSANAVSDDKYRPLQRRLQPETQKSKRLKANTLSNVNLERFCSSLLGMTCQPYSRCAAAQAFSPCAQELPFFFGQKPTMQIEYECFIMQG